MNFKRLSILLSGLVMILGTTTAFAIWDDLSDSETGNTINIGTGATILSTAVGVADWLNGDILVPSEAMLQANYVSTVTGVFDVAFSGTLESNLFLDVNYDTLLINSLDTYTTQLGDENVVNMTIDWDYDNNPDNGFGTFGDNVRDFTEGPSFYDVNLTPTTITNIYVRVTVTLDNLSQEEYDAIAGQDITFNLNFEAGLPA